MVNLPESCPECMSGWDEPFLTMTHNGDMVNLMHCRECGWTGVVERVHIASLSDHDERDCVESVETFVHQLESGDEVEVACCEACGFYAADEW